MLRGEVTQKEHAVRLVDGRSHLVGAEDRVLGVAIEQLDILLLRIRFQKIVVIDDRHFLVSIFAGDRVDQPNASSFAFEADELEPAIVVLHLDNLIDREAHLANGQKIGIGPFGGVFHHTATTGTSG